MSEQFEYRINGIADGFHQVLLRAVRLGIQQGAVAINTERCKGCGLCVDTCPAHTLSLSDVVNMRGYNYSRQINEAACIGCASCALVCPDACITVYRTSQIGRKTI